MSIQTLKSTVNTVEGRSREDLEKNLRAQIARNYRAAWVVDRVEQDHYTLAGLREYYVQVKDTAVKVRRAYRDAYRGVIKPLPGRDRFAAILPEVTQLHQAY